jgi:hypothetical protein
MDCWHCNRPAQGACRFCGRAVCRDHAQSLPHIEALYHSAQGLYRALVVADALYCGVCQPREDPVELPELT